MSSRPRINIKPTKLDKIIDILRWIILISARIFVLWHYKEIPDQVAIHYNFRGEADSFGPKYHLIILLVLMTILSVGIQILNRFPHRMNYPIEITKDNALKAYSSLTKFMRYFNIAMVILFSLMLYSSSTQ